MRIKNTNFLFNKKQIRKIINFVKSSRIANFDVWVKNSSKRFYGRAYYKGTQYHNRNCPYVVIRIGKNKYPYYCNREKGTGYLSFEVYSAEELLVHLLAHELRHLWQSKVKKGYRVWGARGQFSERDADAYAIHKVREWRRKLNKKG